MSPAPRWIIRDEHVVVRIVSKVYEARIIGLHNPMEPMSCRKSYMTYGDLSRGALVQSHESGYVVDLMLHRRVGVVYVPVFLPTVEDSCLFPVPGRMVELWVLWGVPDEMFVDGSWKNEPTDPRKRWGLKECYASLLVRDRKGLDEGIVHDFVVRDSKFHLGRHFCAMAEDVTQRSS